MKRKYRLKSAEKAVLHGFHNGDFSGADRIEEHNAAILADVFKRIQYGLVDVAYMNTGGVAPAPRSSLKHFLIKHMALWQNFGVIVFCRPAGFMWARIGAKI